jgi:CHAT domain-containing protein
MYFGNSNHRKLLCTIALSLFLSASAYSQLDEKADQTFEKTIQTFKAENDAENFTYAFLDHYLTRPSETRLSLFDRYEKELWRPLQTPGEHLAYTILLCNKGYYITQLGEPHKAIDVYERAWKIFNSQRLSGFDIVEYCLKPLATNYSMLGDYSSAGNIVKNYLFQAEREKNQEHLFSGFVNLSIIYHETGNYTDAIKLLEEAVRLKNLSPEKKGLIYSNLSRNYLSIQELTKAKRFALQAETLFKNDPNPNNRLPLTNIYSLLSLISVQEQNLDNALKFIEQAQRLTSLHRQLFKNRDLAKLLITHAGILKIKKAYSQSLKLYKEALTILLPTYKPDSLGLPDVSLFYAENALKEALDGLADLYLEMDLPENALACYDLSFDVEDLLRVTYNYDEAKLQQQLENRDRTEQVINILHKLAIKTKDTRYVMRAFQRAERTKAITLKERIENRYQKYGTGQDSLRRQESYLRYKQATLASEIAIERLNHQRLNIDRINQLVTRQTKITIELRTLDKLIKEQNTTPIKTTMAVEKLQTKLENDNATLIEFFTGKNALYTFRIDAHSIELDKTDSLKKINNTIIQLNSFFTSSAAINNQITQYKTLAIELFTRLKLPQSNTTKNLILIPDGLLNLVPFDALLYEKSNAITYSSLPFLIKKYAISYQPSAFLYSNFDRSPILINKKGALAMFPVFEKTENALHYSQQEASEIHKYIDGTYLFTQQATKKAFLDNAGKFSIIHLSTHASAGDYYKPPSITFIDSVLYLPQVYGLKLNADLLVLSACETGVGTVVKGEGALSLARGFQFAGVHNIIFSLWKVNDYATAELMAKFYAHYTRSGSKAEGLHHAKLGYMNDETISNSHKSPYYWAGFVYYGNMDTQPVQDWNILELSLATFVILMTVTLILYFFRRKKALAK